jgi:hypothetical protein
MVGEEVTSAADAEGQPSIGLRIREAGDDERDGIRRSGQSREHEGEM